jgi:hypothetical protein
MPLWKKRDALQRALANQELHQILSAEPGLVPIMVAAAEQRNTVGYDRGQRYSHLKHQAERLVGWHAQNAALGNSAAYEVVVQTIADLLPPDDTDLYPDGVGCPYARQRAREDYDARVTALAARYSADQHMELRDDGVHAYVVRLGAQEYSRRFTPDGRIRTSTLGALLEQGFDRGCLEEEEDIVEELWP